MPQASREQHTYSDLDVRRHVPLVSDPTALGRIFPYRSARRP
jgi:hypothetical protein